MDKGDSRLIANQIDKATDQTRTTKKLDRLMKEQHKEEKKSMWVPVGDNTNTRILVKEGEDKDQKIKNHLSKRKQEKMVAR